MSLVIWGGGPCRQGQSNLQEARLWCVTTPRAPIGLHWDTRTPSRQAVADVLQAAYPLFPLFGSSDGPEDRGVEGTREGAEHHEVSAPP